MTVPVLNDGEINGFVDGQLDPDKRSDVLRKLAASPVDRQRVEAWQEQNDLIRAAFGGIEKEPLPAALNLTPHVHILPSPAKRPEDVAPGPSSRPLRPVLAMGIAAILVVIFGLGAVWLLLDPADRNEPFAAGGPLVPLDESLADRADAAVAAGTREPDDALPPAVAATHTIPDLSAAGFAFARAEASVAEPTAVLFHYRNAAAERIVVSVARDMRHVAPRPPRRSGRVFGWHRDGKSFAIAGSIPPDRLRLIAFSLSNASDGR